VDECFEGKEVPFFFSFHRSVRKTPLFPTPTPENRAWIVLLNRSWRWRPPLSGPPASISKWREKSVDKKPEYHFFPPSPRRLVNALECLVDKDKSFFHPFFFNILLPLRRGWRFSEGRLPESQLRGRKPYFTSVPARYGTATVGRQR